jgi:hypothetical protein
MFLVFGSRKYDVIGHHLLDFAMGGNFREYEVARASLSSSLSKHHHDAMRRSERSTTRPSSFHQCSKVLTLAK